MATTMKTNKKSTQVESPDNNNPMEFKMYSRFIRVMNDLLVTPPKEITEAFIINKISYILYGDAKDTNFKLAAGNLKSFQAKHCMYLMKMAAKAAEDTKNSNADSVKK